tara:strand:- start:301 stop:936 length:636 start_codon:yes stop_codon:yes gene_type:complete
MTSSAAQTQMTEDSSYPLIDALENSDATYRELLSQYTILSGQHINNKAAGKSGNDVNQQKMSQIVASLGSELNKMNGLLNTAYGDGMTNQQLSSKASNALAMQSSLIDMRMKQYQEARDSLALVMGEESTSSDRTSRNRLVYYVYFIFALALCVSIVYMVMGGSLPFGLLIILLVLGVFISWEFYKSWLAKIGTDISLSVPSVKGVFRIVT